MNIDPNAVSTVLASLEQVPAPIREGAITGISRLMGGFFSIPEAHLRSWASGPKNKADASAAAWKIIGEAVGNNVAGDKELLGRATINLLGDAYRKQNNREAIAQEAIILLSDNSAEPNNNQSAGTEEQITKPPPSEDWMNVFVDYAEKASSEAMQALWAKVLAGEIRSPGNFSLSTMRFLAELDRPTAQLFESASHLIVNNDFIIRPEDQIGDITTYLLLEEAGLINGASGLLSKSINAVNGSVIRLDCFNPDGTGCAIICSVEEGKLYKIPNYLLTRIAKEICLLLPAADRTIAAKQVADHFVKNGANKVEIYHIFKGPTGQLRQRIEQVHP